MSGLIEKFYGRPGESGLGTPSEKEGVYSDRVKFAVSYTAIKYFIDKSSAEQFFRNVSSGAQLLQRASDGAEMKQIKSK